MAPMCHWVSSMRIFRSPLPLRRVICSEPPMEGKTHSRHQWLWGDSWTEQRWSKAQALSA
jgi:hypothetical protein